MQVIDQGEQVLAILAQSGIQKVNQRCGETDDPYQETAQRADEPLGAGGYVRPYPIHDFPRGAADSLLAGRFSIFAGGSATVSQADAFLAQFNSASTLVGDGRCEYLERPAYENDPSACCEPPRHGQMGIRGMGQVKSWLGSLRECFLDHVQVGKTHVR